MIRMITLSVISIVEMVIAISASIWIYFGFSTLFQKVDNMPVAFQILTFQKITGAENYILNSLFFFSMAILFLILFAATGFLKNAIDKELA
ncbi:hypothetical protein [Fontibacter flavus]|uniref:Uncharacterized protein n=1 Tax=Fontibacter flavus TaxID=654838 RepID=A0ABV6FTG0_9BACT